jgi:uncharacterized protein with HEPN domain
MVRRLPGAIFRSSWTQPVGLRHRIVHGYWSIDMEILHTTATDLLAGLVKRDGVSAAVGQR